MKNTISTVPYFNNIPNETFSEKSLIQIHDFWNILRNNIGLTDVLSITDMLCSRQIDLSDGVNLSFLSSTTIAMCALYDAENKIEEGIIEGFFHAKLEPLFKNLWYLPLGDLMCQIQIEDNRFRFKVANKFLLYYLDGNHAFADHGSMPDYVRFLLNPKLGELNNSPFHIMASRFCSGLQFSNTDDSEIVDRLVTMKDLQVSYKWLNNLCNIAAIRGIDPNTIASNANYILDKFFSRPDATILGDDRDKYIRHILIGMALGNDELLRALNPTKDEIIPDTHNTDKETITASVLQEIKADGYNSVIRSLDYAGISLNLDDIISVDEHRQMPVKLLTLELKRQVDPDLLVSELIKHPKFESVNTISIPECEDLMSEEILRDFYIASAKRINKKLKTTPAFPKNHDDDELILLGILKNGDMSQKVYKRYGFSRKLLDKHKELLPRDMIRNMLVDDLGL